MPSLPLSVVVLFYHGNQWVDSFVDALENQTLSKDLFEVVLVDNGGTTPSVQQYNGIKNLRAETLPKNFGFAGGNNRILPKLNGEFVFLVNQDTILHPACLEEVLAYLLEHPEKTAASGNMKMITTKTEIDFREPVSTVGFYRTSLLGYVVFQEISRGEEEIEVEFVSGNALAFRKSIVKDIGGHLFDEELGSYMEDLDLSLRLVQAGYHLAVIPKARVYHFRGSAFGGAISHQISKFVHISGNRLIVYYKNLSKKRFLFILPLIIAGIPQKVFRSDADRSIHPLRFLFGCALIPAVFIYFILRIMTLHEKAALEKKTEAPKQSPSRKAHTAIFLFMILVAFLFAIKFEWGDITASLATFDWRWLPALFLIDGVAHLATAFKNSLILRSLGYTVSFPKMFAISMASIFSGTATPGSAGIFMATPMMKQCFQVSLSQGFLFQLIDRVFGIYLLMLFALAGIFFFFFPSLWLGIFVLPAICTLIWLFFRAIRICDESINRFGVPEYGGMLLSHLGRNRRSQFWMTLSKSLRYLTFIALFLLIAWIFEIPLGFWSAWLIVSVSIFAGTVSMIPLGIASMDAAMLALGIQVGITAEVGMAIIAVFRAVTVLPVLFLGVGSGIWLSHTLSQKIS